MTDFDLQEKFDLAALLMDSATYLLTNEDVYRHLRSVARHLNPNGLYVLEMNHPKFVLGGPKSERPDWEMERDGKTVRFQWGQPDDPSDPITQIEHVTTIITMAHGFNLRVVAEGVENAATYAAIKGMACDFAQGYYLGKPMPQDRFIAWLNQYRQL